MELELNKVHHLDNRIGLPMLPEKCANLIIADGPYFEVKGDFDFVYKSFDEYLEFMEGQAKLYKRILADNGTLFVYGHAKKIAYVQTIFDKYFNLENNIAIEFNRQTKKGVENFRCFAPVSERLLMYSDINENYRWEILYHDIIRKSVNEVQMYLGKLISKDELTNLLFNKKNCINIESAKQNAHNILSQRSHKPQMITELQYSWIAGNKMSYKELRNMFDDAYELYNNRAEEEKIRRPFNNFMKLYDVMKFDQEAHITKDYDHETIKPEKLTRALILTCSRPNDLVVIPFAGSGTEAAMSAKEGRRFVAFETTEKHVKMSNERVRKELSQTKLFAA